MVESDHLRYTRLPLNNGSGAIPALGFGTLIPDLSATRNATKAALEAGFRQLDTSERYRNEKEVGEAMQEVFRAGQIKRQEVFIAAKLLQKEWHRVASTIPEDAMREISEGINLRVRFNTVVETGVPGFIPRGE
jgi:diketogulonate reductase-like aldo/keto reductase